MAPAVHGNELLLPVLGDFLTPSFFALYVLHTPRGEAEEGRYQSPAISRDEWDMFFDRFRQYLAGDARFDLWLHSPADNATLVWDRHNILYSYGPVETFEAALGARGLIPGELAIPDPHQHCYRSEFDSDAEALLTWFNWKRSPLRPEDEQRVD